MKPLQQGNLDGLCGLYSLLNAARLAVPTLPRRTCTCLFREGAHWLYDRGAFPEVLYAGMTIGKLMGLHKAVFQPRIPGLRLKRPFIRSPPANTAEFWERLKTYAEQPGQGVIIGIGRPQLTHWSVVSGVTTAKVMLFDSNGSTYLVRDKCAYTGADVKATTIIMPNGVSILVYTRRR